MRLQHAEKVAGSLPAETLEQEQAKAVIVTEARLGIQVNGHLI